MEGGQPGCPQLQHALKDGIQDVHGQMSPGWARGGDSPSGLPGTWACRRQHERGFRGCL